jgi:hypothetical protein
MKHLKKFNESDDYNDCDYCHDEGKDPYCSFCKKSYLDELDRKKPINWTKDEDDYPDQFATKPGFVEKRMKQQKEYESKFTISMSVPVSAYELLTNSGVPDENIVRAYTEYVKHSLGLNTHTAGVDEFRVWCEESDNLVDFQ